MKTTLLALLFLISASIIFATPAPITKGRISGKVVDKLTGEALEYATVSVLDTAKKALTGGMTNAQGEFKLENLATGHYILKISYIGYIDVEQSIDLSEQNSEKQLGEIALEADNQTLDAAVITARRPTVERLIDKLVITVANSIMAQNSTALEVLRKSPGLAIDRDGNITLNGQSVAVWVDNRPTHLSGQELVALLEGMEGSTIDKIEIIDQPSSKYDAAGSGGIVNIITKKNFMRGFNGSVRAGYTQFLESNFYYGANGTLNLNYRNDLINTYMNLSARSVKRFEIIEENVTAPTGYTRQMNDFEKGERFYQNVNAGIDFFIDKKNIIGLAGNFSLKNASDDGAGNTLENNVGNMITSDFLSNNTNRNLNGVGNLNYSHYFDDKGHELTLNADYLRYTSKPKQYMHTVFSPMDSTIIYTYDSEQAATVVSGKADYILPIGESMKLEAGGKIAFSATDNEIVRMDSLSTGWSKNRDLSDDFTYRENIGALYATYGWKINSRWNVKGGLRWEHTNTKGVWRSADSSTTRSYNDFFPTVFAGYNPAEKHNISLSYTRRIERPNYWELNPFRRYLSTYSYIEGNADLLPSYTHRLNFSYTGFNVLTAGITYSYSDGAIAQIPTFDTLSHASGYRQDNFGMMETMVGSVSLSELPIIKWWFFTLNLEGGYFNNKRGDYRNTSTYWSVFNNNTFVLAKTWKAEAQYQMESPLAWAYFNIKLLHSLDIGIQKTLWDDKGTLSLYVDDVFATRKNALSSTVDGVTRDFKQQWQSRSVRLSFLYRFGNAGKPVRQRNVGQQEELQRLEN
jgi:outer membrane receptor protein involved in Fe transport